MQTSAARRVEEQLISVLRAHGALSRADLARLSGLPRSTVVDALARLRATAQIDEVIDSGGTRRAGRPSMQVRLRESEGLIATVALTHQSLRIGLFDRHGSLMGVTSFDSRLPELADGFLDPVVDMLETVTDTLDDPETPLAAVVLGLPTVIDADTNAPPQRAPGSVRSDVLHRRMPPGRPQLGPDPAAALQERLGVPVWAENDANLGTVGEFTSGAGIGYEHGIYIKTVDGLGAGLFLGGRLHRGFQGRAGELIHLHVRDGGPVCICGGRGCLATEYNSPRLLLDLLQPAHEAELEFADVVRLAREGDAGVSRLLNDLGHTLGRSLADLCVYLGLQVVILDSTLGVGGSALRDGVVEGLARYAPPRTFEQVSVLHGVLGLDAEITGAAVLARERLLQQ